MNLTELPTELIQHILVMPVLANGDVFNAICSSPYLNVYPSFQWRQRKEKYWLEKGAINCVLTGDLKGIEYLATLKSPSKQQCVDAHVMLVASMEGSLSIVKYLHENLQIEMSLNTVGAAVVGGKIDLIKYMIAKLQDKLPGLIDFLTVYAINQHKVRILQYLFYTYKELEADVGIYLATAAGLCAIDMFRFILNYYNITPEFLNEKEEENLIMDIAAYKHNPVLVKFLHEECGMHLTYKAYIAAVDNDNMLVADYIQVRTGFKYENIMWS